MVPSKPVSPPTPDRLRGQRSTRFARSASLVIDRLVAGARKAHAHHPAVNKTVNNQGPPGDSRFSPGADTSNITRPKDGTRVYIYNKEQRLSPLRFS